MNRSEFYDYILENFNIDATAACLIDNILRYIEENFKIVSDQHKLLCDLLDGFGLTFEEITKVKL